MAKFNASSCPEDANSTDCLLRGLLQNLDIQFQETNNQPDWDPLTFGFTVPVGILAALFAAFTIYQATLAAGRGSRKSNKRAIGKWANKTKKDWDWHELCRISTAQTPILTTANILETLTHKISHPDSNNDPQPPEPEQNQPPECDPAQTSPSQMLPYQKQFSRPASKKAGGLHHQKRLQIWISAPIKSLRKLPFGRLKIKQQSYKTQSDDPATATWLDFLNDLGLDYFDLENAPTKKTIADYIPDDLLAVPAYAEVGFIVAAAAAAGAQSWDVTDNSRSGLPTLLARNFQFEFRPHDTFGTVGTFVKYNLSPDSQRTPTASHFKTVLLNAHGDVELSSTMAPIFQERTKRWHEAIMNSVAPNDTLTIKPSSGNPTEAVQPKTRSTFNVLQDNLAGYSLLLVDPSGSTHSCTSCLCESGKLCDYRQDKHHLTWLFLVDTMALRTPAIFPLQFVQLNPNVFTILALHSTFWAGLETKRSFSLVNNNTEAPNLIPVSLERWHTSGFPERLDAKDLTRLLNFVEDITGEKDMTGEKATDHRQDNYTPFGLDRDRFTDKGSVYVFGIVLEASIKFLYSANEFETWFNGLPQLNQQYLRVLFTLQLGQIEQWLHYHVEAEKLLCEIYSLQTTTLALLDIKHAVDNGSFGFSAPKDQASLFLKPNLQTDCSEDDILARHFGTLQVLGSFLDKFKDLRSCVRQNNPRVLAFSLNPPDSISDKESRMRFQMLKLFKEHAIPLSCIVHTGTGDSMHRLYGLYKEIDLLFQALSKVLKTCCESMSSNATLSDNQRPVKQDRQWPALYHEGSEAVEHGDIPDELASTAEGNDEIPEEDSGGRVGVPEMDIDGSPQEEAPEGNAEAVEHHRDPDGHAPRGKEEDKGGVPVGINAWSGYTFNPYLDYDGKVMTGRPPERKPSGDFLRDILIWKCMITAMLYSTAPDNSELLSSGAWERIVPVI